MVSIFSINCSIKACFAIVMHVWQCFFARSTVHINHRQGSLILQGADMFGFQNNLTLLYYSHSNKNLNIKQVKVSNMYSTCMSYHMKMQIIL